MERARTPRVRPNGHTPGVRCLVASKNIKGTRRGGSLLRVVSNKVKQTQQGGSPLLVASNKVEQTRREGSPLLVASNKVKQTGRVSPLVASNRTHRCNGEGLPSSLRPMDSNRRDREGKPSPSRGVE